MNNIRLLAVFAENKPDQLARVTRVLADHRINIHWVGIADVRQFGVIRFLVDRPEAARDLLHSFTASLVEILAAEVPDQPGALAHVAQILAAAGISITNCSGFVFNHRAILLIETDQLEQARQQLQHAGIRLITEPQLLTL